MASPDQLITIQLLPLTFIYHNSACPRHCALVVRLVVHVCPPHRRPSQLYACPFDRTRPNRQGYGLIVRRCLSANGEHESPQDKVKSLLFTIEGKPRQSRQWVQPNRAEARTLCKLHRSRNHSGQYTSIYKVVGIIEFPPRNS